MRTRILFSIVLALAALVANAQDDFNPKPPADPNFKYKVKVVTEPAEAGYTYGGGYYDTGANIYISTSARTGYRFLRWKQDGTDYSTQTGFSFTVGKEDVEFVAVYESIPFEPPLPGDPNEAKNVSKIFLECNPSDGGSFNIDSGRRFEVGEDVTLTTYPNQGFKFLGWYSNGELLDEGTSFSYHVVKDNVTITARYEFAPSQPGDPTSSQDNVDDKKDDDNPSSGTDDPDNPDNPDDPSSGTDNPETPSTPEDPSGTEEPSVPETPSGIDAVSADADKEKRFNMKGQRVNKNYKGIVIKNGKKVVIK